ncbi:hypothetical protein BC828DRAFT_391121 [Blastocladiella britannica]|nr:hypothetical protein BC828DRAFT_391121 [Blastocladiella britannica]
MFADTLGHSMWAVPYGNLSVVAVVVLVLAVVFPWAWSTTTTRHGSTTEINGMAWWSRVVLTARPVPFRAWLAAAAASATVAVLSLVASVTVVAATLAFQPMAVSGRPMLVLVLAFLAAAAATAGMMAAVRARAQAHCHTAPLHHTSDDREEAAYDADIAMAALGATVHAQRGVYGVWVGIMLPLVAVAGTRTAVLSHWLWYAVAMVAGVMVFDLGMWTVSWVMSSNDGPGDGTTAVGVPMTPTSAGSDVHAPLLLPDDGERSPGSPALDPHHQETERATPFTNLKAAANHLLHSPALRASALFLLSSTFPTAIDLDFSLNYTYGLAFAVQEGLPGLAIAGFFGFLVLPITLCAQPVLVSVDPRTARRVSLWCLLGTLVLAVYLALVAWPFTADAPLKVGFAVSTTRVGVVSEAALNAVVAAAAAGAGDVSAEVVFATNPTPPLPPTVVVVVSGVPAYVDPALLFGGVAPVRPCDDRNVCRFTPTSLAPGLGNGTADVPAMRVTVRSSSASSSALSSPMLLLLEDGAQPAYLVDLHLPVAAHLTCTVSRDAPTLIAPGAAVTVFSSINTKQSNPLPPPPVLSLTAAGAFAVAMSDPTSPPLPITLAVPSHWTSRAWSLTCRAALEDPVWGTQVYRSAVAMRADWVALTAGPGARGGLVVVDTTVHFPAAVTSGSGRWWGLGGGGSDGSGADGAEGGSASGIWSWIFGSK